MLWVIAAKELTGAFHELESRSIEESSQGSVA
jgi:hypothetical protein